VRANIFAQKISTHFADYLDNINMAVFPTIESIASALSFILATLASLRAASRLERRICNNGAIGLMDGPPILGPTVIQQHAKVPSIINSRETQSKLKDEDGNECNIMEEDDRIIEASPLWEHTEAFRRAVILGLILDEDSDSISNSIFSDIVKYEGKPINVRGGSEEDLAIAAAVDAGLLLPNSARSGDFGARHRVRGGGSSLRARGKSEDGSSPGKKPIGMIASWFVRELSAPIAAIPAWHGLLCTFLREQKENKLRRSQWCLLTPLERLHFFITGRNSGKIYDPSALDFDASISAVARIPGGSREDAGVVGDSCIPSTKTVRVKAFAPQTFRDLRNRCFRVKESEFSRSILNAIDGAISTDHTADFSRDDDSTISNVLKETLAGAMRNNIKRIRHPSVQTLPYISFQSNSKGAARAGTFFFFTADGAYMIKTVKKEEAKAFLEMLPEYHRFMSENVNGRNSLLTRIFGMYSVRGPSSDADAQHSGETGDRWDGGLFSSSQEHISSMGDDERIYLVMHSVFPSEASAFVTERFDLKGSTVGRECSLEERSSKGANAVLKDLNLMREVKEELTGSEGDATGSQKRARNSRYGICIGKKSKVCLMAQLERDVDLLHRCNVLDYSLLVGVADMEASIRSIPRVSSKHVPTCLQTFFHWVDFPMPYFGAGTTKVDGGALSSLPGTRKGKQVMYYLGVIDFLQPWTAKKRLERDLKGLAGYDKSAISCVAPSDYADRFLKFVNCHVT